MESNSNKREGMTTGLRNGDPDAFRELVQQHKRRVLNTCHRFVQNPADAEDLAQEVFLEVYRSRDRFRGDADVTTWIYRIAVSKSLDFIRKRDREKRGGGWRRLLGLGDSATDIAGPVSLQPDAALENQERRRILNAALSNLPERQRTAFILSSYDGFSYEEVARILGTSLSSVESLIHRARKNLQSRLENYYRRHA